VNDLFSRVNKRKMMKILKHFKQPLNNERNTLDVPWLVMRIGMRRIRLK
jgi:hypothetical protein